MPYECPMCDECPCVCAPEKLAASTARDAIRRTEKDTDRAVCDLGGG